MQVSKRKQPEREEREAVKENEPGSSQVVVYGGVGCSAASLRAVRRPFKVRGRAPALACL